MNITYTQNGDYLIPNIVIRKTKPIGHYGRLRKEDYALVEELREQMAIAQCEENESHFKYGFSAGLLVQKEAYEQVAQREKE